MKAWQTAEDVRDLLNKAFRMMGEIETLDSLEAEVWRVIKSIDNSLINVDELMNALADLEEED